MLIFCQNLLLFVEQNLRQSICLKYIVYHNKIMRRTRRIDSTINLMSSSWTILLFPVWSSWYSWFIFDNFLHLIMSRGNQKIEYKIVAHLNLYCFLFKIEFKIKEIVVPFGFRLLFLSSNFDVIPWLSMCSIVSLFMISTYF